MLFSNVIKLWRRFYSVSFSLFFNYKLIMLLYRYYYKFDEETLTELRKDLNFYFIPFLIWNFSEKLQFQFSWFKISW